MLLPSWQVSLSGCPERAAVVPELTLQGMFGAQHPHRSRSEAWLAMLARLMCIVTVEVWCRRHQGLSPRVTCLCRLMPDLPLVLSCRAMMCTFVHIVSCDRWFGKLWQLAFTQLPASVLLRLWWWWLPWSPSELPVLGCMVWQGASHFFGFCCRSSLQLRLDLVAQTSPLAPVTLAHAMHAFPSRLCGGLYTRRMLMGVARGVSAAAAQTSGTTLV